MKKIFSLMIALMSVLAINATDFYVSGIGGWAEPGTKAELKMAPSATANVLKCEFTRIDNGSEFKIFANTGWSGPEYGAAAQGDSIIPNGAAYTAASPAQNLKIALADKHYLTNAVLTFDTLTYALTLTGTDVDGSAEAPTYQLVGACTDNWSTTAAVQFEEVEGVLTATIEDLNGTFKILQDRKWTNQWATNWDNGGGLAVGVPYVLGGKIGSKEPSNLSLANPFGGYKNAVLTLTGMEEGGTPTLTLVSGNFYKVQADWFFPGGKLGWNCDATTKFEPVAGKENTFEYLAAEFSGDFKVVYGVWAVEFGAAKGDTVNNTWTVNEPMTLATPCDNMMPADATTYQDVTATIVVDYEKVSVVLTLEVEGAALEEIAAQKGAQKFIENGKVIVVKDGIRYTAAGQRL